MIIEILFALSLISNVVMVLYVRWVLNNYKEVVEKLDNIEMLGENESESESDENDKDDDQ